MFTAEGTRRERSREIKREIYGMDDLKRLNEEAGYYFFSADAVRGFRSRSFDKIYIDTTNARAFFITSEQSGYDAERRYTVRFMILKGEDIGSVHEVKPESAENISPFQYFDTGREARAFLNRIEKGRFDFVPCKAWQKEFFPHCDMMAIEKPKVKA